MPIHTNFAKATAVFHLPLPGTKLDAQHLNRVFAAEKLKNSELVAVRTPNGITLTVGCGLLPEVISTKYWKALAVLIKRTKEPWWDFAFLVVDDIVGGQAAVDTVAAFEVENPHMGTTLEDMRKRLTLMSDFKPKKVVHAKKLKTSPYAHAISVVRIHSSGKFEFLFAEGASF